jgi:signal transduction histidine kinase
MVIADDLIDLGMYGDIEKYLSGLAGKRAHEILKMINNLKSLVISGSIVSEASEKAAKVIGALKTYSHTSTRDLKSAEDITSSIDTVLTLYYNKTKSGIRIIKKYEPVAPVICYPDRIGQIWTNLINNAFHAMDYNGVLEIWVRMVDKKVAVSITDNGKGIDKNVQDKIFNPYFTTKKSGEGTGLGLDIVKKIVETQGGSVSFESDPGRAVFTVYLDPEGSE